MNKYSSASIASRALRLCLLLLALMAGPTHTALAQSDYPNKPIKFIVPFPAGGATDNIARPLQNELLNSQKWNVIIDNKPGAGGNIGAELVSKSPPDGYTWLMASVGTHGINLPLYTQGGGKLPFDPIKDFTPITLVAELPNVLVLNPAFATKNKINTVKDLIAYAKANPGKLTFASSGAGAPQRLAMEMFRYQLGLDLLHVPYKGSGPAMTDLVGGQVLSMSETVPAALQFIQAGQLRALAVTTNKRISQLPDVPTITEATGLPNFDVVSMFGIEAPAGTPKTIIYKLSAEIKSILQRPDVQERMLAAGVYVNYLSPAESSKRITRELNMWAKVIKDANIKAD